MIPLIKLLTTKLEIKRRNLYRQSYIYPLFFNVDISINIVYKLFKFGMAILDIIMEGTMPQIFNLGHSSHFITFRTRFFKIYQMFPDFMHNIQTKT